MECYLQIVTSSEGLFRQTTFYPLKLFSTLMLGASLDIHVQSPSFEGATVPPFIQHLTLHTPDSARLTKFVDVSAVLSSSTTPAEIRVAIVNRSEIDSFMVHIAFGPKAKVEDSVKVYEVWSEDLKDRNGFGEGEDKVKVVERVDTLDAKGCYMLKSHSFQSELILIYQNDFFFETGCSSSVSAEMNDVVPCGSAAVASTTVCKYFHSLICHHNQLHFCLH